MALYYLDGNTLADSTAVYTDAALTTCAADGFYSDGTIVRELSGCLLLPAQDCPSCNIPCGNLIAFSGDEGLYNITTNVGSTPSDVGAIVITFTPAGVPDGIKVSYDGNTYNELSSPVDGYHASTVSTNFTFVGDTANDCGISGSIYLLNEYSYSFVNSAFEATGDTESVTVAAGDVSLSTGSPGDCVIVVPKVAAGPSNLDISIASPCIGANTFNIDINCPRLLTAISSTIMYATKLEACAVDPSINIYNVPVNGSYGTIGLYDWVFYDDYGQGIADDGFYKLSTGDVIEVQNGIVIQISTC
jgi:hypothetical protein